MQHRKPAVGNGRPSGTDGSDFSYRMVVDSRYTKVAKGKYRLSALIFTQAILQLVGVIVVELTLVFGYLLYEGRRRSRVNFLRFYMFASSIAVTISIACVGGSNFLIEVIQDQSRWETKKFELFNIAGVLLASSYHSSSALRTSRELLTDYYLDSSAIYEILGFTFKGWYGRLVFHPPCSVPQFPAPKPFFSGNVLDMAVY
ncbi:hypothetical protein RHSIM_Rhsim09G0192300 [Rhododendron simsii]|uniref:Uncharacterized protein n=1 Tax=Rhododendron simsii TaxID=118357 RepID=A0A834GG23_RHOSS|nr:hypothetical protein RHSIM_Rhsim09G0192300 [Rhododendron simsii]